MDDPFSVRVREPASSLTDIVNRPVHRQRTRSDGCGEIASFDELHNEIPIATLHASVVGLHNVRMREPGRRLHFTLEAFHRRFISRERGWEQLDRAKPLKVAMLSLEDLAHSASANFGKEDVIAQHQGAWLAAEKLLRLKRREESALDEELRHRLSIAGASTCWQRSPKGFDFVSRR
nr:hypothetical protein [Anatilimnocola floriformis]